ncbi:MAG: hypothetical protein ACIAQF_03435 [Phycisphaerales bacterium JB065]
MASFWTHNFDTLGPHRLKLGGLGRAWEWPYGINGLSFTNDLGPRELVITQTGRLVASTEPALWSTINALKADAELPRNATLVGPGGQAWTDMTLMRFTPQGPIDRGRVFSLAYTITYIRIND